MMCIQAIIIFKESIKLFMKEFFYNFVYAG